MYAQNRQRILLYTFLFFFEKFNSLTPEIKYSDQESHL